MSDMTKVSELVAGPQLDALVARAQGWKQLTGICWYLGGNRDMEGRCCMAMLGEYQPSTNGEQWSELIEKFKVAVIPECKTDNGNTFVHSHWSAFIADHGTVIGSTPAVAICRAIVASKWGDTIPDEIMEQVK